MRLPRQSFRTAVWLAQVPVLLCGPASLGQELGEAPQQGPGPGLAAAAGVRVKAQGLTVDTHDSAAVVRFFQEVYRASEGVPFGWQGDIDNCVADDTAQGYKDATVLRVNYFRAMAGLPGNITLNGVWNQKCQQAALMLSAQDMLSHAPPPSWACYTADGSEAAGNSNIALGLAGPEAVDLYMDDYGGSNSAVGHRRWILYPPQGQMGTGSVPDILDGSGGVVYRAANSLWVIGGTGDRPAAPGFVAWPPPGFVPSQVLPVNSQRWSFGYPSADFTKAQVFMASQGSNVVVTLETVKTGSGDHTLVWRPSLAGGPQVGATYSVTVTNFVVAGQPRAAQYEVTVIDASAVRLSATRLADDRVLLSWPRQSRSYAVVGSSAIAPAPNWVLAGVTPQLTNGTYYVLLPEESQPRFYRLRAE